jgi:5-methylcytosine-specific restriction endonuclease McrA
MIKVDPEATAQARFRDPRSYVGFRTHPETEHACVYLFGEDVGERRDAIREKYEGNCSYCGEYCWFSGELHHKVGGLGPQRCWCFENLTWSCKRCHEAEHGRTIRRAVGGPR